MSSFFDFDYVPGPDPVEEFNMWMKKAIESSEPEPTAMALATVDRNQRARVRTVLYKGMSSKGLTSDQSPDSAITFFTNYESSKSQELEFHPHAAVVFHWKTLELQIRIEGRVTKTSREESEKYFISRPRESQIGAWVSLQSRVLSSRSELEKRREEIEGKFSGKPVPCPTNWGGYKLQPELFEFWISGEARLHNRFQYTYDRKQGWVQVRLWP